jgi:hypothetical protein
MRRFTYKVDLGQGCRRREILISSGRNRHATPVCISKYLRNRPRAGGSTSQCARLVGCHVKIASSGAKHKPNPTGGREGSQISGVPKAGKRTKTQRFKKKGVLEGLHQEISGFYTGINQSKLTEPLPRAGVLFEPAVPMSASGPKQTCTSALHMSAFGGKADMARKYLNIR